MTPHGLSCFFVPCHPRPTGSRPSSARDAGGVAAPDEPDDGLARARALVLGAERVVALTGAGISTESGIADFRGPNGVWTKNPAAEKASNIEHYLADPDVRRTAWRNRLDSPIWSAEPNRGHRALVELERRGVLRAIVTQNIDELHQRAGSSPSLVLEAHGTAHHTMCWSCGDRRPMPEALERVAAGEADPPCRLCGGILKSATISFGQALDTAVLMAAERAAAGADVLLAVGSTLTVHPVAGLVPRARREGAALVIVNADPTPYDPIADVVLRGRIGDVLPAIVA
jgi:NAD-dependent deacetylase